MRKRKQTMVLVSLIVFVVVLVIAYLAMLRVAKSKEAEAVNKDAIELFTLNTEKAEKLTVKNENGTFAFLKGNNDWTMESDSLFPLDETAISTMLSTLKTINASRSVKEDVEDLDEYGLDNPKITISIELEDGVRAKIELGDKVPIQGGYYAMVDGENHVYVMDESYYTNFSCKQSELMIKENAPAIDAANVTYLKVDNGKDNVFEASKNNDGEWMITKAFEKAVRGDNAKLQELFAKYGSISYGECVEYNCKDTTKYGITKDSAQIDLNYFEEADKATNEASDTSQKANEGDATTTEKQLSEFHLRIGTNDGKGNYYVQPEGSTYVYLLTEETVQELLDVNAFGCIYPYLVSDTIDTVKGITIVTKDEKSEISIKKASENEYSCKRNNKKMEYDAFSNAYTKFLAVTYKGVIDKSKIKGDKVYATITIKSDSGQEKIQFVQYDDNNYYRAIVNGEETFLVEIKEVQSMIDQFSK